MKIIQNIPDAAPSIAAQLASFAHDLEPGMLPTAVVERFKLLMLDALGVALASSQLDFAHCAYCGLQALGGPGRLPRRWRSSDRVGGGFWLHAGGGQVDGAGPDRT
ncbi:hypothetical protein [Variovorax sp. DAIF25]|uniref:hypothetical protein n=1 Tax=Variovorax sp. DAIF25 TaxID=3080983 RepID=UPI003D6AF1F9